MLTEPALSPPPLSASSPSRVWRPNLSFAGPLASGGMLSVFTSMTDAKMQQDLKAQNAHSCIVFIGCHCYRCQWLPLSLLSLSLLPLSSLTVVISYRWHCYLCYCYCCHCLPMSTVFTATIALFTVVIANRRKAFYYLREELPLSQLPLSCTTITATRHKWSLTIYVRVIRHDLHQRQRAYLCTH